MRQILAAIILAFPMVAGAAQDAVVSAAFSPDGTLLATGDTDKTVKLWDVTGKEKEPRVLGKHGDGVYALAFSPDGHSVASGSNDNTVKLWDVAEKREIRTLAGHTEGVWALAFSPDGRWLASGGWDKTIRIWDLSTGEKIRVLTGHEDTVSALAFSPDGSLLASGSFDYMVRVWDPSTGEPIQTLDQPRYPVGLAKFSNVLAVAFSPDGAALAASYWHGQVRIWDVDGWDERLMIGFAETSGKPMIRDLDFSPSGDLVAWGDNTGSTFTASTAGTGEGVKPNRLDAAHRAGNGVLAVSFAPDGSSVLSAAQAPKNKVEIRVHPISP